LSAARRPALIAGAINMAGTLSTEESQQFSTHVSRRRVVAGAVTLAVAGTTSPAFAVNRQESKHAGEHPFFES
jgi:hypothetical protein